jgi:hypothetical protein
MRPARLRMTRLRVRLAAMLRKPKAATVNSGQTPRNRASATAGQ